MVSVSFSWPSWWQTCRRCQEVQACWENKRPSRRQKRRVLWAPSLAFRHGDKQTGACAEVLCSTVRSGRRVREERPGGIQSGRLADWPALWEELSLSRRRKMKNWSWAWRRSCWRSLSICEGRWGKTFSCLLIQTSCLAGPSNSPAPRHAAAESVQASRDPSCGGHHWGRHPAGGGQHDWQSLQQRHSELGASRPSIVQFPNQQRI